MQVLGILFLALTSLWAVCDASSQDHTLTAEHWSVAEGATQRQQPQPRNAVHRSLAWEPPHHLHRTVTPRFRSLGVSSVVNSVREALKECAQLSGTDCKQQVQGDAACFAKLWRSPLSFASLKQTEVCP